MATKTDERFFDVLRALAAFCVVCAHSAQVNILSGLPYIFSEVLNYLGTMGVPVFFLISGFSSLYGLLFLSNSSYLLPSPFGLGPVLLFV